METAKQDVTEVHHGIDNDGYNHPMQYSSISMKPIAYFSSVFTRKNATPRQGSLVPHSKGYLELLPETCFGRNITHHSLVGLKEFSHIWIIYIFHDNGSEYQSRNCRVRPMISPPRLNGRKVGVFATRSPHRPNPIGLTLAKLEDVNQGVIHVSGIDLIDGTPVIDIKPYIPDYDNAYQLENSKLIKQAEKANNSDIVKVPSWVTQSPVKPIDNIIFTAEAINQLKELINGENKRLKFYNDWREARLAIEQVLYLDPRSIYRRKKCADQTYWFHLDGMNISVKFDDPNFEQLDSTIIMDNISITATIFKIEMWSELLDSMGIHDEDTRNRK
jgi:tRNA-Thr(GGU) m(6)t(6)A37 methyltransferase TsaA